jgi:glycosyltransferase involved in cell wall biosynthesis
LKEQSKSLPENVEVVFEGSVHPSAVLNILVSRAFDLFVNVSETEGVPVSIMEALSAGIPVLATAVGGTPEIVDDTVGRLIDVNTDEKRLAKHIEWFINARKDKVNELRANAFKRYSDKCDMDKFTRQFIENLVE